MIIHFSKKFDKMFKKCPDGVKEKFIAHLQIFKEDKNKALLNNHALFGKLKGYRSINIGSDWRAIYTQNTEDIIFVAIGTHSQLYK